MNEVGIMSQQRPHQREEEDGHGEAMVVGGDGQATAYVHGS